MAKTGNKPKRGKTALGIAAAAPLALALVHGAMKPSNTLVENPTAEELVTTSVKCEEPIEGFEACHSKYPAGCSDKGTYDPRLNELKDKPLGEDKNAVKFFTSTADYAALEKEIPSDLGKNNHADTTIQAALAQAGEGQLHGVIGYLYDAKAEDKESSNCELPRDNNEEDVDFHIWIGFKPLSGKTVTPEEKKSAAIVEMTPHTRPLHPEGWTTGALKEVRGKKVRVVGQLMVDNEHNVKSQNCGLPDHTAQCWRLSVWELHPVTSFEVCTDSDEKNCTATSGKWTELGKQGQDNAGAASTPDNKKRPGVHNTP